MDLDSVVATDTRGGASLCCSPFCFSEAGGGLGLLCCVECEMLQRRAIVLPCFVLLYKKEEINTHFLRALGSIPPPVHLAVLQGRRSHVAKHTHPLSGTEMQTTHFVLSSRAFKSHHITGGGHQIATSVTSW